MNTRHICAYMFLALLTLFVMVPPALSLPPLGITMTTEKLSYHYRQLVNVFGNVTYNGGLVEEGLVALQITFPHSLEGFNATRTVPAHTTPTEDWTIEILSFITCDGNGDPQTTFSKGGNAWFNATIRNNAAFGSKTVLLALTLCDSDATPFKFNWARFEIPAQGSYIHFVRLDLNAYDYPGTWISTGSAKAYANVYTTWPSMGGSPYSPEKQATFNINSSSMQTTERPATATEAPISYSSFQAAFRLPPNIPLGTYTITGSAYYKGFRDTYTVATFYRDYELEGDVLYNRKVDIFDVVLVASAYGTKGGVPLWNPEADLEPNGKVDIFDVVTVAGNYGKTY